MPTALELKREEWVPYIAAASRHVLDASLMPAEQKEREQLLDRVREVAENLELKEAGEGLRKAIERHGIEL